MLDDRELLGGGAADALGRRVGRLELRVLLLDRPKLAHQRVVLAVGDLGIVEHVVPVVVVVDLPPQLFDALHERGWILDHASAPDVPGCWPVHRVEILRRTPVRGRLSNFRSRHRPMSVRNPALHRSATYTSAMQYELWHVESPNLMDDFDTEAEVLDVARLYLTPGQDGVTVDLPSRSMATMDGQFGRLTGLSLQRSHLVRRATKRGSRRNRGSER